MKVSSDTNKYYFITGLLCLLMFYGVGLWNERETEASAGMSDDNATLIRPTFQMQGDNHQSAVVSPTFSSPYRERLTEISGVKNEGVEKVYSKNVYTVRDKFTQGIAPEVEEIIAAYQEIYADRPESFKRNLEREFIEILNPSQYCNESRKNWASPYILEVHSGHVFVDEILWQKNSPSNQSQLAQYLSRCTQDEEAVEILSDVSGITIAQYSLEKGYMASQL